MKIAYLVNQYPKVSHSFVRREIFALERQGFEIERYALRGWDAQLPDADDQRELTRTKYLVQGGVAPLARRALREAALNPLRFAKALAAAVRQWRGGDRSLAHNLITLAEACELKRWTARDRVEHLHVHFGTNGAQVAMLSRLLGGVPYSFTVHGPEEWDAPRQLGLRDKAAHARFVIAISEFTRSQLYRWTDRSDWPKVAIVPCGLEPAFHQGEVPPAPESRRLVCVGRLCAEKAQVLLIEAVARLKSRGVAFELVLAGDGDARAELEASIQRHGLRGSVRITGWISSAQVRDELLAARAMVLPSFNEGLPVVIMEALALGRPVISTYVAGIPELVRPGREGWLVPAGSIDALADAIEECLSTPIDALRALGASGHARVLERHDVDVAARMLSALLLGQPQPHISGSGDVLFSDGPTARVEREVAAAAQ